MCPTLTFEEGTELIVDQEVIATNPGFADHATAGSDVWRMGGKVTLGIRVTNVARAAWVKKTYKKGELVTEGGHTYEAIVEPTDETAPSTKPADWKDLGVAGTTICTLPPAYRPAVALVNAAATLEVKANGEVIALDSLAEEKARAYDTSYRAATVSP